MTLIAHLWQSTLFAAAVAVVALLLRRREARTRHALWLLASIKFVVPFSILTLAGSAIGSRTLQLATTPGTAAGRWLERSRPFWTLDVSAPAGTSFLTWPAWAPSISSSVLWAVWIGGSAWLLAWRFGQWRQMVRVARAASPLHHGREAAALRSVARRADLAGVALRQVPGNQEPAVVGVRSATILWPEGLAARLTDEELEAVFAHELCHVARRDNLSSLMQIAVEILFWFHPMVWWLSGRLVHERERACDEEVMQMVTDKANYATGILKVCGFCLRAPAAFAAGIGSSGLAQRIERILSAPSPRGRAARTIVPAIVAITLAAPLAAGVLHGQAGAAQDTTVYKAGNGITAPKLVKEEKPKYTRKAMQEKIQGGVSVSAVVRADGTVGEVKVTRSLDKVNGLDDEAVATVKKWKFEPGLKDGKPVAVEVEIEMTFKLK